MLAVPIVEAVLISGFTYKVWHDLYIAQWRSQDFGKGRAQIG